MLRNAVALAATAAVLFLPAGFGASQARASAAVAGRTTAASHATATTARAARATRAAHAARRAARPAARPVVRAATATAAAATAARTPGAGLDVGVQFHGTWSNYTEAQRARVLDVFAAAGVATVRVDVGWASLQSTGPGSYDAWQVALVDSVMNQLHARGMTALVTLWSTPDWANGGRGTHTLPTNPADYARVAQWAAARWAGTARSWEVWNEPNSPDYLDGADPAAYARLLRAAYPAFHAGDPTTTVVLGGVSYNDDEWLAAAYAAGVRGAFDVMATHPYMGVADASPALADDGSMYTLRHLSAVHDLMVRNGDGAKPVWLTELGWSSHANTGGEANWNRGVTEAQQGAFLTQTAQLVASTYPYVQKMFWYSDRDDDSGQKQQDNYGLLHRDLTPKRALGALAALHGRAAPSA